jgi:hypothetical protein
MGWPWSVAIRLLAAMIDMVFLATKVAEPM